MRLTIQSFQRRFDVNDPEIEEKLEDYSKTLIQQIDTMSAIANAFSNFAKMPTQKNESLNVVEVVKLALDIFNSDWVQFTSSKPEINIIFDRTQLIRIITNLIKNAKQAGATKIIVEIADNDKEVVITIRDNGEGIAPENQDKIFEPKFTTKTSGMGLGLAMVKKIIETYNGSITFTSSKNAETVFTVTLPKQHEK